MKNFKKLIKESYLGNPLNEVVRGDDFRFIEIKDLHFETDPDRLEDMKIEFGEKMGGFTTKDKIEDAEYELKRFRKEIGFGDGSYSGVFLPGTYDAVNSKLGDGPHAKKVSTPKWNERKYEQWIKDVASGGGAEFAYDMAQNAKMEAGLIDWVKKNRLDFGDVTPLERIQYDIEALAESVNEDLIKETTVDGGNYRSSYQHNQPEEQLTTTEDYEIFMEMFPKGEASRILMDPKRKELYDKHLEWTKESDYNNTFEHMQYHKVEHEGELYKVHQSQYYNGNYKDFRNPRFTELMISKDGKSMGTYLVDTYEYIKDLNNLKVKVSESINESVEIPAFMMRDGMYREVVDDSINYNDFEEKIKSFVGPKYYKMIHSEHPGALKDFFKKYHVTNPNLEEDEDLDINYSDASAGDKSIEDESASGAYESKTFDFKKMIKEALTPNNLK